MGNMEKSGNLQTHPIKCRYYQWNKVKSMGEYEIVRDRATEVQGERYWKEIDISQKQDVIYEFRHDHAEVLPKVLSLQKGQSKSICVADMMMGVVIERIPYRLIDLGHLGYSEGLYIMEQSLRGGKLIWDKAGSIHYDDSMICFNKKGESKIWLNENLSLNSPQITVNLSEKEQVQEIMTIIETRMGGDKFISYMNSKNKSNVSGFQKALRFIQLMRQKDNLKVESIILPSMIEETEETQKTEITTIIPQRISRFSEEQRNRLSTPQKNTGSTEKFIQKKSPIIYENRKNSPLIRVHKRSLSQKKMLQCPLSPEYNRQERNEDQVRKEYYGCNFHGRQPQRFRNTEISHQQNQQFPTGKILIKEYPIRPAQLSTHQNLPKMMRVGTNPGNRSIYEQSPQIKHILVQADIDSRVQRVLNRPLLADYLIFENQYMKKRSSCSTTIKD